MKRNIAPRSTPLHLLAGSLAAWALAAAPPPARAAAADPGVLRLEVQLGPITGAAGGTRTMDFNVASRKATTWYDVQDGLEHHVRGLTLVDLLAAIKPPRAADAVVFGFADGMQIPVSLRDRAEVKAIFIALEHGDPMGKFDNRFLLKDRLPVKCPKVVYARETKQYSIWHYPTQLTRVSLVSWKLYEDQLAQPTRRFPDHSGWPIYMRHCQPCHGLGGQGARRGADFLSDMDAYRRVPPLAVTDRSQHPSLHEKVKGFTEGQMPVLNHVSNEEIATLWRWLHGIHQSAVK
jgi:hypothetical protein